MGVISLKDAEVVITSTNNQNQINNNNNNNNNNNQFQFQIVTRLRIYFLIANSEHDMMSCINTINEKKLQSLQNILLSPSNQVCFLFIFFFFCFIFLNYLSN